MTKDERQRFVDNAKQVSCTIGDMTLDALPRQFASGSLGWHSNGKGKVQGYRVQVNVLFIVIGSKADDLTPCTTTEPAVDNTPTKEEYTSPIFPPDVEAEQLFSSPANRIGSPPSDPRPENGKPPAKPGRKRS